MSLALLYSLLDPILVRHSQHPRLLLSFPPCLTPSAADAVDPADDADAVDAADVYAGAWPRRYGISVAPSARKPPCQRWLRREAHVLDDGVSYISESSSMLE